MSSLTDITTYIAQHATPDKLLLAAGLIASFYVIFIHQKHKDLAPGPWALPYFGNAFQVPTEKSWVYFYNICKKFGPMVRLNIAGSEMLILNEVEDIDELLVKRSGNYSSRKQLVYAGKYRSDDKRLVLLPYGPMLKKQRAAVFQMLNARVVGGYEDIQERGAMKLLSDVLKAPTNAYLGIKWYTAQTLLTLVYGKEFDEDGGDLRTLLHILETFIQDMHPLKYAVDTFPVLDWLPDAVSPWRAEAKKMHKYESDFYSGLLKEVRQRMDNGENLECFAARLWEGVEKLGLDEMSMAYVAGSAFEAGTDNTAGSILWFLVAMLHNPDVIKKAQVEIDNVLGADGVLFPTFKHLEDLPYTVAIVKETFRWMPVAPVSAPHQSIQEDFYKGYRIPANTNVVPNVWAIHHNEKLYPEADSFKPERFMPKNGEKVGAEALNEGHYGFGFGRRTCPGQYLASKSVWIGVVRLLWAFNIEAPLDASGNKILPDVKATRLGLTAEPDSFNLTLTPRSPAHAQTIKAAWGS